MTIRSGRVIDGTIYTDEEYAARVTGAFERQKIQLQPVHEAFKALGFDPTGMKRGKTEQQKSAEGRSRKNASDPSPYAQNNAAPDSPAFQV